MTGRLWNLLKGLYVMELMLNVMLAFFLALTLGTCIMIGLSSIFVKIIDTLVGEHDLPVASIDSNADV